MELVSVLMSVYKEPFEYLKVSIESIIKQTYQNLQIVIVIDNPEDQQLCEMLENYAKRDSRILIIKNKTNVGIVESLNNGLEFCNGMYIARMDADDVSVECRIEKQIQYLKKYKLDMVGTLYDTFIDDYEFNGIPCTHYKTEEIYKALRIASCLPHPTWLGKKDVFIHNKGYRNIKACEDYDFLIRAYNSSYKLGNLPEILLHYRLNPNSISHINSIDQKIIFKYLSFHFKNNHIVSLKEYNEFIDNSYDYLNLKKAYRIIVKVKEKKTVFKYVKLIPLVLDLRCLKVYLKYK